MTHETLTVFHAWLQRELPCHEGDLVHALGILHRMMPKTYADWPADAAEVSAAMQALAAEGLVEKRNHEWRAVVQKPEAMLF